MKTLYILTEDDSDSLFYEACAERITGWKFNTTCRRVRGRGLSGVRKSLKIALGEIRRMATGSGVCFLLAMDNDRAPHAEAMEEALSGQRRSRLSGQDAHQNDRYAACLSDLTKHLGVNRAEWKTPVAVAVPVEMIESWLLLIARDLGSAELPRFAWEHSASAQAFHHPAKPGPQLKDLRDRVRLEDGFGDPNDWLLHLALEKMQPEKLAEKSRSFALFKEWLDGWRE
jgi:hypothetical protein